MTTAHEVTEMTCEHGYMCPRCEHTHEPTELKNDAEVRCSQCDALLFTSVFTVTVYCTQLKSGGMSI